MMHLEQFAGTYLDEKERLYAICENTHRILRHKNRVLIVGIARKYERIIFKLDNYTLKITTQKSITYNDEKTQILQTVFNDVYSIMYDGIDIYFELDYQTILRKIIKMDTIATLNKLGYRCH